MRYSQTRFKGLSIVLNSNSVLSAEAARMAVLYEDLRIELTAATHRSIKVLDYVSPEYRRFYFLRRSIATILEFADSVRVLSRCSEFQNVQAFLAPAAQRDWFRAVRFFNHQHDFFQRVRNDIGGHFGSRAARYAVSHIRPTAVEKIEYLAENRVRAGFKMSFAGEIVAIATLRHLPGPTTTRRAAYLLRRVVVAFRHAGRAMDVIAVHYLWPRFG